MAFNFGPKNNLIKAELKIVDNSGNDIYSNTDMIAPGVYKFYINPTSWKESKKANWIKQQVPGLSDPHQQWISSGPRTINFEALVTKDLAEPIDGDERGRIAQISNSNSVTKIVGGIASQLLNIPGLTQLEILNNNNLGQNRANLDLDINFKLNYYRRLVYPNTFDSKSGVANSPFLVRLLVGSTFGTQTLQTSLFVVDNIDITITKQLPNLTPIEAIVGFTLTEFVSTIRSSDQVY